MSFFSVLYWIKHSFYRFRNRIPMNLCINIFNQIRNKIPKRQIVYFVKTISIIWFFAGHSFRPIFHKIILTKRYVINLPTVLMTNILNLLG